MPNSDFRFQIFLNFLSSQLLIFFPLNLQPPRHSLPENIRIIHLLRPDRHHDKLTRSNGLSRV